MGVAVGVPYWVSVLSAAGGDPLRAQEIEDELNEVWYWRWRLVEDARGKADKVRAAKANKHDR